MPNPVMSGQDSSNGRAAAVKVTNNASHIHIKATDITADADRVRHGNITLTSTSGTFVVTNFSGYTNITIRAVKSAAVDTVNLVVKGDVSADQSGIYASPAAGMGFRDIAGTDNATGSATLALSTTPINLQRAGMCFSALQFSLSAALTTDTVTINYMARY